MKTTEKTDWVPARAGSMLRLCLGMVLSAVILCDTTIWSAIAIGADADPAVERIMTAQENLASISRRIEKETYLATQGPPVQQGGRKRNVVRLQEIKFIHQRLINTLKKNISFTAEEADLKKNIESGRAFALAEKKPYSLSYYDKLLDEVAAVQQKKEALTTSAQNAGLKLEKHRAALEKTQQTWRRVREEVEAEKGDAADEDLEYLTAQLERETAQATLELQEALQAGLKSELRLVDLKQQAAQQKLDLIRKDLSFDPDALDVETARLEKQKSQLDARLKSLLSEQNKVASQWQADRTTAGQAATESALKARQAWRETYETVLQQNEEMTQWINTQAKLWKYRYALVSADTKSNELGLWAEEASAVRQNTRQAVALYQTWQVNLQSRVAAVGKELGQADPMVNKYVGYQLDALRKSEAFGGTYFSILLSTGQLADRLLEATDIKGQGDSILDKALSARSKFRDVWNFELWVIDDHGVTVKKVATALAILILGIFIVKRAIRLLSSRLTKAKFAAGAVASSEKLLLYVGIVLVVLFALRTVNIPLTAFTFLGGAIAIGVGFGAQNLINNFISGFIIMAERPIRIGDLIEMNGKPVRVQKIGARCTQVKTEENIHILVPNSSFLENNITNWTLSDKKIRLQLSVGVAYGSDVKKVTEALLEAADQSQWILKTPKSRVIFQDFGDSYLVFDVHYWLNLGGMVERRLVASDLRYRINHLFTQNNIVIAFPQQDVHLDVSEPLEIKLSNSGGVKTLKQRAVPNRAREPKRMNPK